MSRVWIALAAVVAVVGAAAFLLWPRTGCLVVNVTGPGGVEVPNLTVKVNNEKVCGSSPCRVPRLAADTHILEVSAPGYQQPVKRMVTIRSGADTNESYSLVRGSGEAAGGGTGLVIAELGKFLRVRVDGVDRGEAPLRISDLSAGDHEIEITGSDRYAPFKEKVTIEDGRMLEYKPKLTVTRGLARVESGKNAAGARVTLDCPNEGESLLDPPTSVDVNPKSACTLRASKEGYAIFQTRVSFDDGKAEKSFKVELEQAGPAQGGGAVGGGSGGGKAATGCKLTVNSIPITVAVVDGRPVGKTPTSLNVPCGSHTVMFIHPQKGRRSVGVVAAPGRPAVASVRF
ncbi:MAG: PEGA domain-containing protein [Polyangiaceae bacterium]|nr:PEGA domain-containing protein [Polyangiaceae bacterium]